MARFVHLHGHSEYSLLDGLSKIKQLIKTTKDLDMDAVAITDHGVMYGIIEFYKVCIEAEIKPIIGVEMYVAKRSHKDKEARIDQEPFHLTVLAKNYQGYLNLIKLVSIAHLEGFYYRPRVDKKLLQEYHEGLIALSGCPAGEFIRSIDDDLKKATDVAKEYLEIFGEENFYFELQNHEYKKLLENPNLDPKIKKELEEMSQIQGLTWAAVKKLSPRLGIPIVATNDYHYIKPEEADAQDAQVCVQTGKLITDINRLRMIDTPNLYLKSPAEMKELFIDIPEALENTLRIAKKCAVEIPLGRPYFPIFDIPDGRSPMQYLRDLCFEKFKNKFPDEDPKLKERLEYELSVIEKKNYATYFLVVSDFLNWAHEHGVITNTRGSAAGCLVLYCLGVTNIDPIEYGLPFERFLNPERPSLPDIDVDLADDRRDEVIRYVMDKYGEDRVAHIITFGTMMGRAAIRDIGRVMAVPYGEVDRIAKLVPPPHQGFHKPLKDAIREVPELSELYSNNQQVKSLLNLAIKVEGTVRHASVHAAGVVISPEPLTNLTPLQREANGDKVVTQYEMHSIEDVGLVKMDFLGIRNLSILGHAAAIVKQNREIDVHLQRLPADDPKAYEILAKGETMGLFQLEGSGMTRYLVDLRPTSIFDIMAMVALYRPGPLAIIPEYIARKHDPAKVKYFDPRMKEYLDRSLGLLVYQDDVLLTAINIAGYSWEEADKFRKAMGKKIPSEMTKQKEKFISGCIEKGMKKEKAEELFSLIEPFAAYGFNKAHAASYAMTAYQTAYMKANFPVEFMAAVMTAEFGNSEKIAAAIEECKRLGIVVLPPDVNFSGVGFTITDQDIRFGLSAIKNVGISAIESIIKKREDKQFKSLIDLCQRVDTRLVNKKTLESLIKAGALDSFGTRASQLLVLDAVLEQSHKAARDKNSGQVSLFGEEEIKKIQVDLPDVPEMPLEQLLIFEKDLLGFYLHEPPYLANLEKIKEYVSCQIKNLTDELIGQKIKIGGVITEIKKVLTKKTASEMAFVKLSDGVAEIEVVIFPTLFGPNKEILEKDKVIMIDGKIDKREENLSMIADGISLFDPKNEGEIEILVPKGTDVKILQEVNRTLRKYPGSISCTLLLPDGGDIPKRMVLPFSIDVSVELKNQIQGLLGENSFKFI